MTIFTNLQILIVTTHTTRPNIPEITALLRDFASFPAHISLSGFLSDLINSFYKNSVEPGEPKSASGFFKVIQEKPIANKLPAPNVGNPNCKEQSHD